MVFPYVCECGALLAWLLVKTLQSYPTLWDTHGQQPTRLLCPQDSLGMNSGLGCHFLLLCGVWYQCILQWWCILALQEKLTCVYYTILIIWIDINDYLCMYIYTHAHNFSSVFLNPGRVAGGKTQHWTTEVNASNFSWSPTLLIHGCCFTQSVTIWLRPASANLLPPRLTALLPSGTHSNYILPHSRGEPERGKCS